MGLSSTQILELAQKARDEKIASLFAGYFTPEYDHFGDIGKVCQHVERIQTLYQQLEAALSRSHE